MFNEQNKQNDFAEIVNIQQTLFRNLTKNHRFYLIYTLSSIPLWASFLALAFLLSNRPYGALSDLNLILPIIFCIEYIIFTVIQNAPLIVRGSNQLRAITKTRRSDDEPVEHLSGIAKYVNTMYVLISNPTFPKRRKDKISSKKARSFEVAYIIQFTGLLIFLALIPILLGIFATGILVELYFIIPYSAVVLSYLLFLAISIKVIRNLKDWQLLFTELDHWVESIEKMSIEELRSNSHDNRRKHQQGFWV